MGDVVSLAKKRKELQARQHGYLMDMPAAKVTITIVADWHPVGEVTKKEYKKIAGEQLTELVATRLWDLLALDGGTIGFKVK